MNKFLLLSSKLPWPSKLRSLPFNRARLAMEVTGKISRYHSESILICKDPCEPEIVNKKVILNN